MQQWALRLDTPAMQLRAPAEMPGTAPAGAPQRRPAETQPGCPQQTGGIFSLLRLGLIPGDGGQGTACSQAREAEETRP